MSDPSTISDAIRDAASDLLFKCDIADVRPSRINAELIGEAPERIISAAFKPTLEHSSAKGSFLNRFTFEFVFEGLHGHPVARMEFVLIVEWDVPSDYEPPRDAASFVASTTGYFAAFPYARELAQNATARLGLDPLVLGILNRNDLRPRDMRVALRTAIDSDRADGATGNPHTPLE